ncbi:MAG: DUF131 domain-containing protein [Nitrososphaerota archaeon]|nr:DUF131 domain-containing protein [Nitrososphaerota archaeon]MDG6953239.1 DUF131 domain-containing protein [Nitrososphaerota archaeon]MDG6957796.1 DUF131 domain-containing protein [Nitrososphaerota archaeon]MDG6958950.1 DUF131 domain-containing protein [Nitrososphaerota archaeon]MDG6960012.1 DUF131 domain-containing protein [Nitrososphaerota archaeon]
MREKLLAVGLLMVVAGFGLVFVSSLAQGGGSVGGVVFIGPFPVVFGSGSAGWPLALASLLVGAVTVGLTLLLVYRLQRGRSG